MEGEFINDRVVLVKIKCKLFEGKVIIDGNPATVTGDVNQYFDKYAEYSFGEKDYLIGKKEFIKQNHIK